MRKPAMVRWATRIRWQWKVFIPIIAVMILGLVGVTALLRTLEVRDARWVLIRVVGFAILLCFVLVSVLLVLVQRPLEELMGTIARIDRGI
jgi:FtsH-binding integral membrane protein